MLLDDSLLFKSFLDPAAIFSVPDAGLVSGCDCLVSHARQCGPSHGCLSM